MQFNKIKERGYLFTYEDFGWDLNIYLITGKKYNYIIDTGLGSKCINPILDYIKNDNKMTIVINTHYHRDHIWGNASLSNCITISHKLCREMIQLNWDDMLQKNRQYCLGDVKTNLPTLVFDEELYFVEDKIKLLHTPGHTPDSISIFDEEDNVLILGDNIGDSMEDLLPSIYCEKSVYKNTLHNYKQLNFDTLISGHNKVLNKQVIDKILNML
ncbi:MAG: Zn-dependent hydrolase [Herbinix sp.]|jgi:glyoxylase-like metal-dependent hydrolase (beta-lactamase superfamily II)|nr:Zn-dependent hydrolase [Herbinix sp.]